MAYWPFLGGNKSYRHYDLMQNFAFYNAGSAQVEYVEEIEDGRYIPANNSTLSTDYLHSDFKLGDRVLTGEFTFLFWLKLNTAASGTDGIFIGQTTAPRLYFAWVGADNRLWYGLGDANFSDMSIVSTKDKWHLIGWSYDGTTSETLVNGEGSVTHSSGSQSFSISILKLFVGGGSIGSGNLRIGPFAIYDRPLNADVQRSIYYNYWESYFEPPSANIYHVPGVTEALAADVTGSGLVSAKLQERIRYFIFLQGFNDAPR